MTKPPGPALPNALAARLKALAPGWTGRVVFGTGTIPATAPAPELEDGDKPRHIGKHKTARKTIDIDLPVGSVSLRCRHTSGLVAVAVWVYRIEQDKWSFDTALLSNCSGDLSAPAFAVLTSHDFTEGTT
jgi:hypothetical protein